MGRGANRQSALEAGQLLYGRRRSDLRLPASSPDQLRRRQLRQLLDDGPALPAQLLDEPDLAIGDQRHEDLDWLRRFAEESILSDAFSDTAVEEEIIVRIDSGNGSSFSAAGWAEPFSGEDSHQDMLLEGQAIKRVIDSYQPSDLPLDRQTLNLAARRLALRAALARLAAGVSDGDCYSWRELLMLRQLHQSGLDRQLRLTIPPSIISRN